MVCKYCGHELKEGALLCVRCGRPVSEEDWPEGYTPRTWEELREQDPAAPAQEESAPEEAPAEEDVQEHTFREEDFSKEPAAPAQEPSGQADFAREQEPWETDARQARDEDESEIPLPLVDAPVPVSAQPARPAGPQLEPEEARSMDKAFTWSIIAIVFSSSVFLSFIGIIASIVARRALAPLQQKYGVLFGKARVARILSRVALILGIALTVFAAAYAILLIYLLREYGGSFPAYYGGYGL